MNIPCTECGKTTRKFGKDKLGNQRYRCDACLKTFIAQKKQMRIDRKDAILCLKLLVEGSSIRSTERITGIHRDTILHLLNVVGERCKQVMDEKIVNIPVEYVEADEIWGLVQKKEGNKSDEEKSNDKLGDAFTLVGIEAKSKLVVCYQLGRRDIETAIKFTDKLQKASDGRFQLTTDGLKAYIETVERMFGTDIDYAQLGKQHQSDESRNSARRYSPDDFDHAKKGTVTGNPELEKVSTSYVERQNMTILMSMRRLTHLTNGFSTKWKNFDMALALHFAFYNFCKAHQTLRVTPAMEAGITNHIWSIDELTGVL